MLNDQKAHDLAVKIDSFIYDFDYYDYIDAGIDRAEFIQELTGDVIRQESGLVDMLQEIIDDAAGERNEYTDRAAGLIRELKALWAA